MGITKEKKIKLIPDSLTYSHTHTHVLFPTSPCFSSAQLKETKNRANLHMGSALHGMSVGRVSFSWQFWRFDFTWSLEVSIGSWIVIPGGNVPPVTFSLFLFFFRIPGYKGRVWRSSAALRMLAFTVYTGWYRTVWYGMVRYGTCLIRWCL